MRCSALCLACLTCLVLVAILGCGPGDDAGVSDRSDPSDGSDRSDVTSAPAKVIVYSPHGPDVLGDYEKRFEAAFPGVDMQWLDMGSQEVYNRVSAEKGRPQADIWWGAPSTMFMRAVEQDLLQSYRPTWAEAVDPSFRDARDRWYGTYRSPLAIVFNTRGLSKETCPQSWDELLDAKWHGKVTIRQPLASGTMRTFIGATILRLGGEDAGIAWLKKLHGATEAYMENPQFLYEHMKRNKDLVSVWLMADIAMQRERNGYPLDTLVPPQTPVLTEAIAIVNGAPHPEWAQEFYEFVTRPDELAHQAAAYWKVPARTDLEPALLPQWVLDQQIDAMDIDWAVFAEKEQAWCDRWKRQVAEGGSADTP
jgi:iron(III) transport system substrate-binding protein